MNKRGISPLIISVILVGFVVVLGSFIFIWTSGLTKGEMEKQSFEFEILDYGARASPGVNEEGSACFEICGEGYMGGDRAYCDDGAGECYCLLIINNEGKNVNYLVTTTGDGVGTSVCDPDDIELGAYESKVFGIVFDDSIVGTEDLEAEVEAVVLN